MVIFSIIARLFGFLKRENLLRLFVILIVLIFVSAFGLYLFEENISLANAFWWSIVTLTTVGYGDITPVSPAGRVIGIFIMFFGIGLLGMFTASVASFMVERKLKEGKGMGSFKLEDHIIICEWNNRAKDIINELRSDPRTRDQAIALVADLEEKPVDDPGLFFIRGDVNEETLKRVNLEQAKTVIILGDDSLPENSRDARVVLSALTVETLNARAYTIVELSDERNVPHCERANADEIIVTTEFSSRLISRAARDHGISKVLSEILSSRIGNDLNKIPVPANLAGKPFIEIFMEMKREHFCTVLAVQEGNDGPVISNPDNELTVTEKDHLIIISGKDK